MICLLHGIAETIPASSCRQIALAYGSSLRNGAYWIQPSEQGPTFRVSCIGNLQMAHSNMIGFLLIIFLYRLTVMSVKGGLLS